MFDFLVKLFGGVPKDDYKKLQKELQSENDKNFALSTENKKLEELIHEQQLERNQMKREIDRLTKLNLELSIEKDNVDKFKEEYAKVNFKGENLTEYEIKFAAPVVLYMKKGMTIGVHCKLDGKDAYKIHVVKGDDEFWQ